jgi:ribosomal protein S27AE
VTPAWAESGGDSVCWLNRVCPECGRFASDEELARDPDTCAQCGASLPD